MMTLDDHDKTSFFTIRGLFCYKVMPFGLKNAGATFLWLVNKIFKKLTGDIVEVYIDDTVIKNKKKVNHLYHLQTIFTIIQDNKM